MLDTHLDWVLAVRDLIDKAGLAGADLVGSSVGGSLAAEIAAIWPETGQAAGADRAVRPVRREGSRDRSMGAAAGRCAGLMSADAAIWKKLKEMPDGANSIEWPIEQTRAAEAAARIFWPLGNTKLEDACR